MKRTRGEKGRQQGRILEDKYIHEIQALLGLTQGNRDLLIEHLHKIQDHYHCISTHHIKALAKEMNLPTAEIYEVATFYHHFDVVKEDEQAPPSLTVRVCDSLSCEMFGAKTLLNDLTQGLTNVRVQSVPCVGRCHGAPVAVVGTNPIEKANIRTVQKAINNDEIKITVDEYIDYKKYCELGGYKTLLTCVNDEDRKDAIITLMEDSNLRGLGGAGFPLGRKWRILKDQSSPKLIAINIDEGEPGTFKDRYYLESDPHRFIEGALIAQWAIAAEDIYIYLRDEYAGCREILEKELKALKKNPPCPLPKIHLRRGAGAYICGEESAMIESIEGKRGIPRLRPPYVAEVGLFGRPTLEHNMESLHWIRDIIERGSDWFTSQGRNGRKGFRSFSVSGRVKKPGVHLAPAGITIRELIDEYCDGMLEGHDFYGYFPGGASSGMLPASLGDIPLDFDTLQAYGSFIGSAAVIVLSNHDKAKELALNAMRFFEHESCGQCTPCRVGTAKAVKLMCNKEWDLPLLEELATVMEDASICGLGQAAPNPLRTAIKYFPEEFK
ncbi:MAG: NADH:ubiquinone oxidoreductase subunit F (NADH-binding)/NADH:ubiquinone oxidoreductase subunit E [Gammaproteobacteria bacterium]|jgi:NADH:ubiquinone oxidoreductase subunit F (NADH-binding)/NADH:ubiquinone oxidoreductase subunit E